MSMPDPLDTITNILDPASRIAAKRAAHPDVKFDRDGAAIGINWETIVADMEMGI